MNNKLVFANLASGLVANLCGSQVDWHEVQGSIPKFVNLFPLPPLYCNCSLVSKRKLLFVYALEITPVAYRTNKSTKELL